jgi:hypothetical protein
MLCRRRFKPWLLAWLVGAEQQQQQQVARLAMALLWVAGSKGTCQPWMLQQQLMTWSCDTACGSVR